MKQDEYSTARPNTETLEQKKTLISTIKKNDKLQQKIILKVSNNRHFSRLL